MTTDKQSVWIGYDPRETDAYAVARRSIDKRLNLPIPVKGLVLSDLQDRGLYTRPTRRVQKEMPDGSVRSVLIDELSIREDYDGAMSTEFAISRFLVPTVAGSGYALFVDADVMARANVGELFKIAERDRSKAVWCVKHNHQPAGKTKMDGQAQSSYGRKNWSSVMLFNANHPANKALTVDLVNTVPGRDLHRFCWLDDDLIGELEPAWNHLVGEAAPRPDAKIVHFTLGVPSFEGYEDCEYADEWRYELQRWAA